MPVVEFDWQAPASGPSDHEATFFEGSQGLSKSGIVDAQLLPQRGPGARLAELAQLCPHGLSQRRRLDVSALELQSAGLAITTDET